MARTRVGAPPPKAKPKPPRPKNEDILSVLHLLPAVAALPQDFTEDQKVWWNKYVGKKFRGQVAKRGKKWDNARTWTHDKFIGEFCDDFYPRLSEQERKQYYILIGQKVYSYLTNHSSRGSTGITIKTKPIKQRVYAQDLWRRENPDAFTKGWEAHKAEHPDAVLNIGARRAFTGILFQRLPSEEQERYRTMAKDELKTIQAHQRLVGDAQHRYADTYLKQAEASAAQAKLCAGILTTNFILAQDENKQFKIVFLMSEGLQDFRKVPAVSQFAHALKNWVEERGGKKVQVETPAAAVYPAYANEMYPLLPDITGMRLNELQKACFQGGHGKVPWELISNSPDDWIEPGRRPAGVPIKDPSGMTLPVVIVWIHYFLEAQEGTIAADKRFQFKQVIAGPSPIDQTHSQESSRRQEFFAQNSRDLWVLEFERTVTKCHAPNGMQYSEHSLAFARFITSRHVSVDQEDPPEWLELPPGNPDNPTILIDGEEKELILQSAAELPDAQRELVTELVDAVNEHQYHIPASATDGIWTDDSIVPAILPPSPPSFTNAVPLFKRFWGPLGYYLASGKAPLASTWGYFKLGTLLGGHTGCVWVVRALILLVLNFAAVTGDLKPPVPPPSPDYDLTRLPINECDHLLGWCRIWIEKIRASTNILKQTSDDRRNRSPPASADIDENEAGPVAAGGPADTAGPTQRPTKPRNRKNKGKGKGKGKGKSRAYSDDESSDEDMSPVDSDESDDSGPDPDFEALDTSKDGSAEDSDGDDKFGGPSTGWGGFSALSRMGSSNDEEEDEPITPTRGFPKTAQATSSTSAAQGSSQQARTAGNSEIDDLIPHFPPTLAGKHVFGAFYSLPPASNQPLPTTYQDIYTGLQDAVKMIAETTKEWKTLAADNPILGAEDLKTVESVASKLPAQWRLLLHFLAARRLAWKRAESMAPTVLEFAPRLILAARVAFRLDAAVDRYCEEAGTTEGSEQESLDALEKLQTKAMMGTAELCWCYKELQAFEKLSTMWKHEVRDAWLRDALTHDVPTLLALAAPLVKWADAAQELDQKLREGRRKIWAPTKRPFDKRHATSSLWYWFGNPHPNEMPHGLHECISDARNAYRNGASRDGSTQPEFEHGAGSSGYRSASEAVVSEQLDTQPDENAKGDNQRDTTNSTPFKEQVPTGTAKLPSSGSTAEVPSNAVPAPTAPSRNPPSAELDAPSPLPALAVPSAPAPASQAASLPQTGPDSADVHAGLTGSAACSPPVTSDIPAGLAVAADAAVPQENVSTAELPPPLATVTPNPRGDKQNPPSAENRGIPTSPAHAKKPRKTKPPVQPSTPANLPQGRNTRSASAATNAQAENDAAGKTRAAKKRAGGPADDDTPRTRSKRGKGDGK